MRLPGYDDLCKHPAAYVKASAVAALRGDPWQNNSRNLKRLAVDVLTAIELQLVSRTYSTKQTTEEWFQTQRATLVFLATAVAWGVRQRLESDHGSKPSAELILQAIERVVAVMVRNFPDDAIAIRKWYSSYDHLAFVVSVSVTTALMVGGAFGDAAEGSMEPDSGFGRDTADSVGGDAVGADADLEDEEEEAEDSEGDGDGFEEDIDEDIEGEDGEDSEGAYDESDEDDPSLGPSGSEDDDLGEDDPADEESAEDTDDDDDDE